MDCREIIMSEEYADFIIGFNSTVEEFVEKNKDFCPQPVSLSYGIIHKPLNSSEPLDGPNYSYEEVPKLYGTMDYVSVEDTGALKLQNFPGLELKGSGTIIGVIDDGIDVYHEAFRYSNGNTRILSVWDQTNQTLSPPVNKQYGSNLTRELIDEELKKDNSEILSNLARDSSHGTFVTGVAAGSNNVQKSFVSPAPQADIVFVKLKPAKQYLRDFYYLDEDAKAFQENDILAAYTYLREVAIAYQKPIIICIPLGTSQGAHNGLSVMGALINDTASRTGMCVVVANGNEGNSRHHYSGKIDVKDQYKDVEIRVAENIRGFGVELWGSSPDVYSVAITSPSGETVKRIQPKLSEGVEYNFLFERTKLRVNYKLVERRTGSELILLRFENPTQGIWTIRVYGDNIVIGQFNMWLPIKEFIGVDTYFLMPDPYITLTNPADTAIPISVVSFSAETGGIQLESSRGYPIDLTVKPTIAAPGVNVYGPSINNSYTSRSGTSVAAALTTGVCAQMMEWGLVRGNRINMNTTEIKNYLIRGAERKPNITYPNREWGYGTVDAFNSIDVLRS